MLKLEIQKKELETRCDELQQNYQNLKSKIDKLNSQKESETKKESEFSNKIIKKLFRYSIEGWVGLRDRNNDFIIMRICCRKCKTIWDQEEKECLYCKTWHPPLFICIILSFLFSYQCTKI